MTLTTEVASLKQLCSLTMPTAAGVGPVISLVLRFLSKRSDIVALFFSQTLDAGLQQDLDRGRRCCTRQSTSSSVLKLPWKCHRNGFVWVAARPAPRCWIPAAASVTRHAHVINAAARHAEAWRGGPSTSISRGTVVVDRYRSTSIDRVEPSVTLTHSPVAEEGRQLFFPS